jgi:hypothetical protein
LQEPRFRVTFEIEPEGGTVRLTVIHEGFEADTEMLKVLSGEAAVRWLAAAPGEPQDAARNGRAALSRA